MTMPAARGSALSDPLIFERGQPGRTGLSLGPSDVPSIDPDALFGSYARRQELMLPEVSEPEVVRHYVKLSQRNMSIDTNMYPLGSCTMKFNPKVNEWAARLPGFADLHPLTPDVAAQGALELMWRLERALSEICGMDHVSLHPAAGAQGELSGLMMIRAYHAANGRSPKRVLIPETAHGTNPASCALNGLKAVPFKVADSGVIDPADIAPLLNDETAAIMITNPNTVGLFETHMADISAMVHEAGGLVYGDGANLNALMGFARPGDFGIDVMQFNLHKTFTTPHGGGGPGCGPVGYKSKLRPFAPRPVIAREGEHYTLDGDRPQSIGRLRAFQGNFGMMVRAYAYIREMGAQGLRDATALAVLNANYLRVRLGENWPVAFDRVCMHEVVISDKDIREHGVETLHVSKRLMDYGFHPPTMYFPLVVKGAMLIEPTETESRATLDQFVDAMRAIAEEARTNPELVKTAPHTTHLQRLDETHAARNPKLRYGDGES